jgi:hypothetical protein
MNKTARIILIIILMTINGSSAACSAKSTTVNSTSTTVSSTVTSTTSSDDAAIRAWADSETETTLQGLSEDNLAKYTQYGDAQFKTAVTQTILDQTATALKAQIGTYISKEFLRTGSVQGYIQVYYNAKYTSATVKVLMSFDANHQVAGQHFVQ